MATPAEIQARMADILNRTDFTARIALWFQRAHKAIQRRHNFKCMEVTETTTVAVGDTTVAAPTDIKKSLQLFIFNGATSAVTRFFTEKTISEVRNRRFINDPTIRDINRNLTFVPNIFSIWYQTIEFYPEIGVGENGYVMRYDYYRYIDPPADDAEDFFTEHAEDYLIYRGLKESAPFLGADSRIPTWQALEREAFDEIYRAEVSQQTSGPLVMRG